MFQSCDKRLHAGLQTWWLYERRSDSSEGIGRMTHTGRRLQCWPFRVRRMLQRPKQRAKRQHRLRAWRSLRWRRQQRKTWCLKQPLLLICRSESCFCNAGRALEQSLEQEFDATFYDVAVYYRTVSQSATNMRTGNGSWRPAYVTPLKLCDWLFHLWRKGKSCTGMQAAAGGVEHLLRLGDYVSALQAATAALSAADCSPCGLAAAADSLRGEDPQQQQSVCLVVETAAPPEGATRLHLQRALCYRWVATPPSTLLSPSDPCAALSSLQFRPWGRKLH